MFKPKKEATSPKEGVDIKLAISLQNQKDNIQRKQEQRNQIGETLISSCLKSSIFIVNIPANLLVVLGTMAYLEINSAIDDSKVEKIDSRLVKLNIEERLNSSAP